MLTIILIEKSLIILQFLKIKVRKSVSEEDQNINIIEKMILNTISIKSIDLVHYTKR